jgi:hypothetical protein
MLKGHHLEAEGKRGGKRGIRKSKRHIWKCHDEIPDYV